MFTHFKNTTTARGLSTTSLLWPRKSHNVPEASSNGSLPLRSIGIPRSYTFRRALWPREYVHSLIARGMIHVLGHKYVTNLAVGRGICIVSFEILTCFF
ncbi:hypothetical protein FA13DRAFT_1725620 [Coprinellus micaceus]|uniref:Uncharacterized protein n=1 Tax=Coprinellus micaceus TaxID=71717 RepID=A0A4Y7TVT2_COPMI|nr:hypothetical protein FA13DRAFT_1725620 [Coprinellus micaceus]